MLIFMTDVLSLVVLFEGLLLFPLSDFETQYSIVGVFVCLALFYNTEFVTTCSQQ